MNTVRYFPFPAEPEALASGKKFPVCGLTLASSGPMKTVRDAENRQRVFRGLGLPSASIVSVSQIHSRIVHVAASAVSFSDTPEGDGIITVNQDLVPCVTVADCMPVYIFNPVCGCFGVLHSGWKGTGIVRSAFELAFDEWSANPADFYVILGPHIRSCCYTVDAERAGYFTRAFGPSCVSIDPEREAENSKWPYRLSLAEANKLLCVSLGVPGEHILDTNECTSCNAEFGSSRREGPDRFTHMAAFITFSGERTPFIR